MKKSGIYLCVLIILSAILSGCGEENEVKEKQETLSEEQPYVLDYALYTGSWESDSFQTVKYRTYWDVVSDLGITLKKEEVENLLSTLELEEKYLSKGEEEAYGWSFCLSGGEDEPILLLTDSGSLYVYGYQYTGDMEKFQQAVRTLLEEKVAKAELYEELTGILEAVFEPENVQQEPEQPQEIPVPELSLPIQMEEGASYTMGYGFLFPSWKNGFLTVDYLLTERRIYPPAGTLVFDKAKVEALLGALDVEEKNFSHGLQVKEELYSWGVDFLDSELTGNCFEISKLNNEGYEEENILLITDQGDIYVKGYYYTGEKEAFKSAFAEFMEGCAAEAGSMEESWQKKLLEAVQSITWREVAE